MNWYEILLFVVILAVVITVVVLFDISDASLGSKVGLTAALIIGFLIGIGIWYYLKNRTTVPAVQAVQQNNLNAAFATQAQLGAGTATVTPASTLAALAGVSNDESDDELGDVADVYDL
jgi:hypothetical protein